MRQPIEGGEAVVQTGAREVARRPGAVGGIIGFVRESWAELNKVDWPGRAQVIQGTVVVLVAVLIVGLFLYGADQAIRPFVRDVLIGNR